MTDETGGRRDDAPAEGGVGPRDGGEAATDERSLEDQPIEPAQRLALLLMALTPLILAAVVFFLLRR